MQVDCHGKTWPEALAEFIARYNRALQSDGAATLDIIHGYGATGVGGTMRVRFRAFLARYPQRLEYQPGEQVDGNRGHTLVLPIAPLPDTDDLLAEQVLEYCRQPRTLRKITGRFRRHGDRRVMQAVRALEKERRLRAVSRGRVKAYEAA